MERSPAFVACNPRDARVKYNSTITTPTADYQLPPRQEGEAMARPWLRQRWDGAGIRRRAGEQLNTFECVAKTILAAHHHLS